MAAATAGGKPPLLPITTPSSSAASGAATTADSAASAAAAAAPALRLFLGRLSDSLRRAFSDRRPWTELVDRSAFSRPDSVSDAASRLRRNLAYFRVNYAFVAAFALAASLLAHPFSLLILLSLLGAWCFLYFFRPSDAPPLVILGRQVSDRETLVGLFVATLLAVMLTSVLSLIISGLLVGGALVCIHGALRVPEDLFLDEPEAASGATAGLLSFLGAAGGGSGTGRI